jgi:adenylate kinase
MYLILLGAPGTGKGTQAKLLADRKGWLHVSTGDMLREAVANKTMLGEAAKKYMDQGSLVPDALVIDMLIERIGREDAQAGFVLDGFPRNLAQAKALDGALARAGKCIDAAVHIAVPDEELVRRLANRWMCRSCGAIYSEPLEKCTRCGGELYQREDDKPETVRSRLEKQKPPADMLAHYKDAKKLIDIDGTQPIDKVTAALLTALKEA